MPKHIIEFNLPDEREELRDAMQGTRMSIIIDDIWQNLFRPHYKHGYSNQELQKLSETEDGSKVIELLGEEYHKVLRENEYER